MSKLDPKIAIPVRETPVDNAPLRSFFTPHPRVQFTGELTNPVTGEVYKPIARTKQSFVAECDINNILKQYSQTGQIRHMSAKASQGAYLDLPDDVDFQTALNIVHQGRDSFATLPAKVRDRFGNDPAEFLLFMADPANQDEAIKLGLATKRPEPVAGSDGGKEPPKKPPQAPSVAPPAPEPPKGS